MRVVPDVPVYRGLAAVTKPFSRWGNATLVSKPHTTQQRKRFAMKDTLNQLVATPIGAFVVLVIAASLEVFGDACFQSGLYRSTGTTRVLWFGAGVAVLAGYG